MILTEFGRYLEDFHEGQLITHPLSKTIFESDNNLFALMTMNHHPVHTNAEYAAGCVHGRILVVGTLTLSLAVGMTVPEISGAAIANLGYDEVRHLAPVFIGDTIRVRSEVLTVRHSSSRPSTGVVSVRSIASNQRGDDVLTFKRSVLLRSARDDAEA